MAGRPLRTVYHIANTAFAVPGEEDHAKAAERLAAMLKHAVVPNARTIYQRMPLAQAFAAGNSDAKVVRDGRVPLSSWEYRVIAPWPDDAQEWEMGVQHMAWRPSQEPVNLRVSEFFATVGNSSILTIHKTHRDARNEVLSSRDWVVTIHEDHFSAIYAHALEHAKRTDGTHVLGGAKIANSLHDALTARGIDPSTIEIQTDAPRLSDDEFAASLETLASDISRLIPELERRGSQGERVQTLRDAFESLLLEYCDIQAADQEQQAELTRKGRT